jgi:hypothetical protein
MNISQCCNYDVPFETAALVATAAGWNSSTEVLGRNPEGAAGDYSKNFILIFLLVFSMA